MLRNRPSWELLGLLFFLLAGVIFIGACASVTETSTTTTCNVTTTSSTTTTSASLSTTTTSSTTTTAAPTTTTSTSTTTITAPPFASARYCAVVGSPETHVNSGSHPVGVKGYGMTASGTLELVGKWVFVFYNDGLSTHEMVSISADGHGVGTPDAMTINDAYQTFRNDYAYTPISNWCNSTGVAQAAEAYSPFTVWRDSHSPTLEVQYFFILRPDGTHTNEATWQELVAYGDPPTEIGTLFVNAVSGIVSSFEVQHPAP